MVWVMPEPRTPGLRAELELKPSQRWACQIVHVAGHCVRPEESAGSGVGGIWVRSLESLCLNEITLSKVRSYPGPCSHHPPVGAGTPTELMCWAGV